MPHVPKIRVGNYEALWLRDTCFWLDGGTMFNTVPRVLWERKVTPDDQHRIGIGLNCLLLRGEGRVILVDAGIGDKLPEKQKRIYRLDPGLTLMGEMAQALVVPETVDTVVLTHLHLDHAGWLTRRTADGRLVPTFPNARHVVQRAEWEAAHTTNELTEGSYRPEDFDLLEQMGLLDLVEGDGPVAPSVTVALTAGHTPGHQIVKVESQGMSLVCPSEIVPTSWHLNPAWLMSYDLDPLRLLEVKRELMRRAAAEHQWVFLGHDPVAAFGRLMPTARRGCYAWQPAEPQTD